MNKLLKRILTVGASFALAAAVAVPAMADTAPATPVTTAEISVEKFLKSDTANKFPVTKKFQFTLEPFAFDKGYSVAADAMPTITTMPIPNEGENVVSVESRVATLTSSELTLDTNDKDNKTESNKDKLTTDKFTIDFATTDAGKTTYAVPGVYTYKLKEITTPAELGISYDTADYFVNIYVTNVVDATTNQPVLTTDGKLMTTVSNITVFKGTNHTYAMDGKADTVEGDLGEGVTKITSTTTTTAAVMNVVAPLTNNFDAEDLTVSKVVTGNLADPTKEFEFTFTPATAGSTGAPLAGYEYTYTIYNMNGDAYTVSDTYKVSDGKLNDKTDVNGNTKFKLKHKQFVVISGLPVGLKYTITEDASYTDYTAGISYQNGITTGTVADDTGTTTDEGKTLADKVIETSAAQEGDNGATRDNHAYYTNNKESTTPTGVLLRFAPFVLLAALLVVGIVFVALNAGKRRKNGYQGL